MERCDWACCAVTWCYGTTTMLGKLREGYRETPARNSPVKVNQAVGGPRKERLKLTCGLRGAESCSRISDVMVEVGANIKRDAQSGVDIQTLPKVRESPLARCPRAGPKTGRSVDFTGCERNERPVRNTWLVFLPPPATTRFC